MPDKNSRKKTEFLEKYFFFRNFRHNRHFFRQNGQKFFFTGKISFKLWTRFHNGATPGCKLCTSMWEL